MTSDRDRMKEIVKDSLMRHIDKSCSLAENITNDLLANGVIVPPCKVGDTVYTYGAKRVKEWKITFCGKNSRGEHKMIAADDDFKNLLEFWDCDIGKTVFLTKDEAEQALKERNNQ